MTLEQFWVISRKKGTTRAQNVESSNEGHLLSVLFQEESAFLVDERRNKEVEDIFNEMGAINPNASRPTKNSMWKHLREYFELSFKCKAIQRLL